MSYVKITRLFTPLPLEMCWTKDDFMQLCEINKGVSLILVSHCQGVKTKYQRLLMFHCVRIRMTLLCFVAASRANLVVPGRRGRADGGTGGRSSRTTCGRWGRCSTPTCSKASGPPSTPMPRPMACPFPLSPPR
jgi:hypothetical protein